jgi:transposase
LSPTTDLSPSEAVDPAPIVAPADPTGGFDWHTLIDHDRWADVPTDIEDLLALLARADLYVQDEMNLDLHPTITRTWSRKGRRGQRRVRAPGVNRKLVAFGAIDWRTGWLSHGIAWSRNSEQVCLQIDHLVERSTQRGRVALLLWDNLGVHTRRGSLKLRECLDRHGAQVRLVYTPPYDPESNPAERLWRAMRPNVTHNHHRDTLVELHQDAQTYFADLDAAPEKVLAHVGSPFAPIDPPSND